jgi:hypothetical protein
MPIIGTYDIGTGDVINIIDGVVRDVEMSNPTNVLLNTPNSTVNITNVKIDSGSNDNTLFGGVHLSNLIDTSSSVLQNSCNIHNCDNITFNASIISSGIYYTNIYSSDNIVINQAITVTLRNLNITNINYAYNTTIL